LVTGYPKLENGLNLQVIARIFAPKSKKYAVTEYHLTVNVAQFPLPSKFTKPCGLTESFLFLQN